MRHEWESEDASGEKLIRAVDSDGFQWYRYPDNPRCWYPTSGDAAEYATEILRLVRFKDVLERLALALGCLPTQFPDAYGHVFEKAATLAEENRALKAFSVALVGVLGLDPEALAKDERGREMVILDAVQDLE